MVKNAKKMICYATGSPERDLKKDDISAAVRTALEFFSDRKSVLIIPPDITRAHSGAGLVTELLWQQLDLKDKGYSPSPWHTCADGEG